MCSYCLDMLREGDELLEVNGISVMGKRTDEIIRPRAYRPAEGGERACNSHPACDFFYLGSLWR
jgi:hypothetical protein